MTTIQLVRKAGENPSLRYNLIDINIHIPFSVSVFYLLLLSSTLYLWMFLLAYFFKEDGVPPSRRCYLLCSSFPQQLLSGTAQTPEHVNMLNMLSSFLSVFRDTWQPSTQHQVHQVRWTRLPSATFNHSEIKLLRKATVQLHYFQNLNI